MLFLSSAAPQSYEFPFADNMSPKMKSTIIKRESSRRLANYNHQQQVCAPFPSDSIRTVWENFTFQILSFINHLLLHTYIDAQHICFPPSTAHKYKMHTVQAIRGQIALQFSQRPISLVVAISFLLLLLLLVILNVLHQLLFKNPNEPPLVFHWYPVIGNTIEYGIEPYKFFEECRRKVR